MDTDEQERLRKAASPQQSPATAAAPTPQDLQTAIQHHNKKIDDFTNPPVDDPKDKKSVRNAIESQWAQSNPVLYLALLKILTNADNLPKPVSTVIGIMNQKISENRLKQKISIGWFDRKVTIQ
jgi:hypothetical protein